MPVLGLGDTSDVADLLERGQAELQLPAFGSGPTGRQLLAQLLQEQLHHLGGLELLRAAGQARRRRHHPAQRDLRRLRGFLFIISSFRLFSAWLNPNSR